MAKQFIFQLNCKIKADSEDEAMQYVKDALKLANNHIDSYTVGGIYIKCEDVDDGED